MGPDYGNVTINHINYLKSKIKEYSSDTILKEYLQNADDSGATELIVTYDKQTYSYLLGTDYHQIAFPSLLIRNNAKFTDDDFKNILELQAEHKTEDAQSTGRFGLGFRSSYSITDFPTILSKQRFVWLDDTRSSICKNVDSTYASWEKNSLSSISELLQTLKVAGYDDTSYQGTIFRLPLRTEEQASISKLSSEIFTFDKFLKWCDDWSENAHDLIFLRNINKLVLQEIDEEGNKIVHLEIKTHNFEKINQVRKDIKLALGLKASDFSNKWLDNDNDLPLHRYEHLFDIKQFERKTYEYVNKKESWAVINGLVRGKDNILLKQAKKANTLNSNVLPWVGVAVQLDSNDLPLAQDGYWYTILPLFSSKHHALLHGWFDLDDGRTTIIHKTSKDELVEVVTRWNELLMEHGIGVLWAKLLYSIKNEDHLDDHYKLWPREVNDTKINPVLESFLINGFYKEISQLDCIYVLHQGHGSWMKPSDNIYLFQNKKYPVLSKAYQEHFQIVLPRPKNYILDSFKKIDINLEEITPEFIREYLYATKENECFPTSIENISIPMLSSKSWLIDIINYCADEKEDYSLLDSLPLQLTMDGQLTIIGQNEVIFDKDIDLELIQDRNDLCIDFDVIDSIETDILPLSWLNYDLTNIVNLLLLHWNELELNIEWIKLLVNFIYHHREHIEENKSLLYQLPIVYQEDGAWANLGCHPKEHSPVLINIENINNIELIKSTGLNVVHPDYVSIYKPLSNEKLICKFNGLTLILHIMHQKNILIFKNQVLREFIIDVLSSNLSWYDNIPDKFKEVFSRIPFIYTVSGKLCSVHNTDLYISTTFEPPKQIKGLSSDYELVNPDNDHQIDFYKKIEIREQTAKIYLMDTIIPFLEHNQNRDDCIKVLSWLVADWDELCSYLELEEKIEIIELLKNSKIIPDQQPIFFRQKASKLYHPSFELPHCLKDNKRYQSIFFDDPDLQWKWEHFLEELNASNEIFPDHVVNKVIHISQRHDENVKEDAICLANYILQNIQKLESMKYGTGLLLDELKKYAWLPVDDPQKYLLKPEKPYSLFETSRNLIRPSDAKLIGGIYFVLNSEINLKIKNNEPGYEPRKIANKLGVLVDLPIEDIFESYRQLLHLDANEFDEQIIVQHALEFYKYLGRQQKLIPQDIPFDIQQQAIRIHQKWVSADRVFKRDSRLNNIFFWGDISRDIKDEYTDLNLKHGLELLGIRDTPDISIFVDLLNELPLGEVLSENDTKQASLLLDEILETVKSNEVEVEVEDLKPIPLLSRENILIDSKELYISDLPAYNKAKIKNDNIRFCRHKYHDLAKFLNVDSLKECQEPKLNVDETIFGNSNTQNSNFDLIEFIETDAFKECILRLLYDEKKISDEMINYDSITSAIPQNIEIVEKLVIDYFAFSTFLYRDSEATTHDDKDSETLYILAQEDSDDMIDSISIYICHAKKLSENSLLYVNRVLRRKMDRDTINAYLDKEGIKELPEKIEFEKESIFYEDGYYSDDRNYSNNETILSEGSEEDKISDIPNENKTYEDTKGTKPLVSADSGVKLLSESDISDINMDKEETDVLDADNERKDEPSVVLVEDSHSTPSPIKPKKISDEDNDENGHNVSPPITPIEANDKDFISNENRKPSTSSQRSPDSFRPNHIPSSRSRATGTDIVSSNDFKPVYIRHDKEVNSEKSKEERERAKRDGDKGEQYILDNSSSYLLSKDNYLEKAETNNPGFDIWEKDSKGNIVRYIEVKALTGRWGTLGAGITKTQLNSALQKGEKWWLFVIEGINTNNKQIWQFENPVLEANKFMFDHSWKQLAFHKKKEDEKRENNSPKIGDIYKVNLDGSMKECEVKEVKPIGGGKLFKVKLLPNGGKKTINKKFDQSWEKTNE